MAAQRPCLPQELPLLPALLLLPLLPLSMSSLLQGVVRACSLQPWRALTVERLLRHVLVADLLLRLLLLL